MNTQKSSELKYSGNSLIINQLTSTQPTKKRKIMQANQYFSTQRLGALLRKDYYEKRRLPLIVTAAVFLILTVNAMVWAESNDWDYHQTFFPTVLLLGGAIFTSVSFSELDRAQSRQFFLSLPASTFEKFISKFLVTGIGYAVVATLLYVVFAFFVNGLANYFFGRSFIDFHPFSEWNRWYLQLYLAGQTVFLLGAIFYHKYAVFKTVITAFLVALGFVALTALCFRLMMFDLFEGFWEFKPQKDFNGVTLAVEPSQRLDRFVRTNGKSLLTFFGFGVAPLVILIIGYFKLKEKEL